MGQLLLLIQDLPPNPIEATPTYFVKHRSLQTPLKEEPVRNTLKSRADPDKSISNAEGVKVGTNEMVS